MTVPKTTLWPVVLTAVAAGVVAALHVGKVPPALPVIRGELGLDLVGGGFVVATFNVLGMLLAAIVGTAADRLGRGRLITAGFLCLGAGGVLGATSHGLPLLLVSRFVEGVGFIAVAVALPAVVLAASTPRDKPLALSLWSIFTPFGMALALFAAPLVLPLVGWRGLWLLVAALCLAALVAVRWALARVVLPAAPLGSPVRVVAATARRPGLLLLGTAFGAYAFQWVTLMVWLPTFLAADMGVGAVAAALLTALVVALNVPGNIVSGWLQRHGVGARALIVAGGLSMGLAALGIFEPALPDVLRLGLCLLFSLIGGVIPACLFATAPSHAPSPGHMGAANGLLMQGSALGQFIGPPLVAAAVAAAGGAWSGATAPMLAGAALTIAAGWLATARKGGRA